LPERGRVWHIRGVKAVAPRSNRPFCATFLVAAGLSCAACASTPIIEGPAPALLPPPPAKPTEPSGPPPGKLYREDIARLVEAGFPSFLELVEVDAHVRDGKFVGWTLLALYPAEFWARVDLKPGDVVTSVNGLPIERDTEAFDCFQAAKTAPRLVVQYLRAGEPRSLAFEIIPRPASAVARR
jgi:hypothetical protein